MRQGADESRLANILSDVWLRRKDRYSEQRRPEATKEHVLKKVEMYRIGG
jgi:cyclic pyranopterin phosphate synthase